MEERVLFLESSQRKFLEEVKENLNSVSIKGILEFGFNIPYPTLKGYYVEENLLPRSLFEDLCHISKINPDKFKVKFLPGNYGQIIGGKKGIQTTMRRYPNEIKKWRDKGIRNSPISKKLNLKIIKRPKLNEELAEFIGAYLGDGTLTKYFIRISGDYRYDFHYHKYLSVLILRLFGLESVIGKEKGVNTSYLRVFSVNLCSFLNKNFKISYGHKIRNKTIIPEQILRNMDLSIACLRGLMDTDGSVSRRGVGGSQFCVEFTSHNKLLLKQVYDIGKRLGIFTFCSETHAGTNKWDNIEKYFRIVGSSNLRHIVRFHLRKYKNKTIYQKDLPKYFEQDLYKNLKLPFRTVGA